MSITELGNLAKWLEVTQSVVAISYTERSGYHRTPHTHPDTAHDWAPSAIRAPHDNESSISKYSRWLCDGAEIFYGQS